MQSRKSTQRVFHYSSRVWAWGETWSALTLPASREPSEPTKLPAAHIQTKTDHWKKGGGCSLAYTVKKQKQKWGESSVVQGPFCSLMKVITLWSKGNHRLKCDADETFADGHSATDRLHYLVLHTHASSDDEEKDASNAPFLSLQKFMLPSWCTRKL